MLDSIVDRVWIGGRLLDKWKVKTAESGNKGIVTLTAKKKICT